MEAGFEQTGSRDARPWFTCRAGAPTNPRVSETYRKNVSLWCVYNRRRWEFEKEGVGCDELVPFACECTSGDCLHAVDLTMHEYESGHMTPDWASVRECPLSAG
jgi:hypothetical protein